jgi:hypothetical protein
VIPVAESYGDTVSNDTVVTKDGVATDDDTPDVFDDKSVADDGFARKFDTEEHLRDELQELIEER